MYGTDLVVNKLVTTLSLTFLLLLVSCAGVISCIQTLRSAAKPGTLGPERVAHTLWFNANFSPKSVKLF